MYIGRFAPSPTGPLHFGSLLAALASFLDARAHQGQWLLRIENIDPPREVAAGVHCIPETLLQFGLVWDGDITWQSNNGRRYQNTLTQLSQQHLTYPCSCSRKDIRIRTGHSEYDSYCATHVPQHARTAIRLAAQKLPILPFQDRIQGEIAAPTHLEDAILRRREGLWSYLLAVVSDDIAQGITHVVRGQDLLYETFKQQQLYAALGATTPLFAHIPLACASNGQKLSKQNLAPALAPAQASQLLLQALHFLGQPAPAMLAKAPVSTILDWGIEHWDISNVPRQNRSISGIMEYA